MDALFFLLGVLLIGLTVLLVLRTLALGRAQSQQGLAHISAYGFDAAVLLAPGERPAPRSFLSALAQRVGQAFERELGQNKARELRTTLNSAGYFRLTVARYLGYRVLIAVGVVGGFVLIAAAAGAISPRSVLTAAALAALAWRLPPFLIKRKARARAEKIDYEVPELVDLLVTTVEAGVGFAAALQMSARRTRGPLSDELRLALREQSMGLTINEAMENMLGRVSTSVSLRAFVQAIVQGETLGVTTGKILRDLAVDMRKRRRQMAEERAQKAPVKLLIPLVFLILPAMFIVILGPALQAIDGQLG